MHEIIQNAMIELLWWTGNILFQFTMDLTEILTFVVCGCCGLLCIVVLYLCVVVRRIRRELNELSRHQSPLYSDANANARKVKDEDQSKRNSSAGRYAEDPCSSKIPNRPGSLVQLAPEEPVTVLKLERHSRKIPDPVAASTVQEAGSRKEEIPLQFVNGAFEPDGSRDHSSSGSSSEYRRDTQPIYTNDNYEDEQPIYENNEPIDEPVYQNRGELAPFNNPERPRLQTMDIMEA